MTMANGRTDGAEVFVAWQHLPRRGQALVLLSMAMQYLSRGAGGDGRLETIVLSDDLVDDGRPGGGGVGGGDGNGSAGRILAAIVIARGERAGAAMAGAERLRQAAAAIMEN